MSRFLAGLVLAVPGLPLMTRRLLLSARRHDELSIVPAGRTSTLPPAGTPNATCASPPPVRLVVTEGPPDPQPDVTPIAVKAGGVRRVLEQRPPCHRTDCLCCRVYAARLHAAHEEIDRLRGELVRIEGRRVNQTSYDTQPFGSPIVPFQASS